MASSASSRVLVVCSGVIVTRSTWVQPAAAGARGQPGRRGATAPAFPECPRGTDAGACTHADGSNRSNRGSRFMTSGVSWISRRAPSSEEGAGWDESSAAPARPAPRSVLAAEVDPEGGAAAEWQGNLGGDVAGEREAQRRAGVASEEEQERCAAEVALAEEDLGARRIAPEREVAAVSPCPSAPDDDHKSHGDRRGSRVHDVAARRRRDRPGERGSPTVAHDPGPAVSRRSAAADEPRVVERGQRTRTLGRERRGAGGDEDDEKERAGSHREVRPLSSARRRRCAELSGP